MRHEKRSVIIGHTLMMHDPRIEFCGEGDFVKFVAILDKPDGRDVIAYVQGLVEENETGLLGDIHVEEQIKVAGGFFGLIKVPQSPRNRGIGSLLLLRFESEMAARGVRQLSGNLPNERPEVIECLVRWYENRGYQVILDSNFERNQARFSGKITKSLIYSSTSNIL